MADISANITKSLQGLSSIPVGDLAAGIQQFSDAVAAGEQTVRDNNVTGRQYNQILKAQAEANKKYIKDEQRRFKDEKKKYKEENSLWQRATKQNKEHLKAQSAMIKGMKNANRELTMYGRAQAKLMGGMQKAAGGLAGGIGKLAGKAGALGIVIIALKTLVDRVLMIDGALTSMSKKFGQAKDTLRKVTEESRLFADQMRLTGTSTKEVIDMTGSIMENLTLSTKEGRRLAGVATLVSKGFGVADDVAGKFFATLAQTTTLTADQTKLIFENMAATERVGVNVGRAVRDLAANSTLIAVQGEAQVENLAKMALYASQAGTDMQGMVSTIRKFADLEAGVDLAGDANRAFKIQIDAAEQFRIAQRNNAGEMKAAYEVILKQVQEAVKGQENLTLFQEKTLANMGITAEQALNKQQQYTSEQLAAIERQKTLNTLVTEQQTLFERLGTVLLGPLNSVLDKVASFLEKGADSWLVKLEEDMRLLFHGDTLSEQLEKGDWMGALETIFAPIGAILSRAFERAMAYMSENWEFNIIGPGKMGFRRTTGSIGAEKESILANIASSKQSIGSAGYVGNISPHLRSINRDEDRLAVLEELLRERGQDAETQETINRNLNTVSIGSSPVFRALGGVENRSRSAIVGEAGGEVVISRSALRSGIGVGGRAASALAGIGVPGYQYGADLSGTRSSRRTGTARGVRAQQAGSMSSLQNQPLREFQESVYQFRLSSIQYSEASRANIQQQRRLPIEILQAVKSGIGAVGKAIMGDSGSSMLKFAGGSGQTMKYMDMFNQFGIGGSLGFGAKGKYVNSPTLMMVGEEGRGEVVIPTERIRKGLPINAGVARELGSIGVPGFDNGTTSTVAESWDFNSGPKLSLPGISDPATLAYAGNPADPSMRRKPGFFGSRYGSGSGFGEAGGFGGAARMAGGMAGMAGLSSAFNTWQQGGNSDQVMSSALTSGISTGLGMGATALLTPVLGPFAPLVGGMIGSTVGKLISGPIGKLTGASDNQYKKYRQRSMKLLKSHVASKLSFEPGIPHGLGKNMQMAITGRYNKPTPGSQAKLKNDLIKNFPNLNDQEAIGFMNLMLGSESNPKAYSYFNKDFGLPEAMAFAKGGVVNRPTNAVIGEAGPEAVVPLENSELVKEMREIRKATQSLVRIIGDGKTTINLDGRVLAETTGLNMYKIAQGG